MEYNINNIINNINSNPTSQLTTPVNYQLDSSNLQFNYNMPSKRSSILEEAKLLRKNSHIYLETRGQIFQLTNDNQTKTSQKIIVSPSNSYLTPQKQEIYFNFKQNEKQVETNKNQVEFKSDEKQKQNKLIIDQQSNNFDQSKNLENQKNYNNKNEKLEKNQESQNFQKQQKISQSPNFAKNDNDKNNYQDNQNYDSEQKIKEQTQRYKNYKSNSAAKFFKDLKATSGNFLSKRPKKFQKLSYKNILTKENILIINDKSLYQQQKINKKESQLKIINYISNKFKCMPVILPSEKKRIIMDIWIGLLIIIRMFFQSLKVGFCWFDVQECVGIFSNSLLALMLFSSFLEMIVNFNSGYYLKGCLVTNKKMIVKNYINGAFIPDLLVQVPLIYNLFIDQNSDYNSIFTGYALNTIGMILQDINKQRYTQKQERAHINRFIEKKDVKGELKQKIQNYVDYLHQQQKDSIEEEINCVMKILPQDLKSDIFKYIYKKTIKDFHSISKIFSQYVQNQTMEIIEEVDYTPGEYLFKEDENDDPYLYLLQNGSILLKNKNDMNFKNSQNQKNIEELCSFDEYISQYSEKISLKKVTKGQQFGQLEFFTHQPRKCSAIALQQSHIPSKYYLIQQYHVESIQNREPRINRKNKQKMNSLSINQEMILDFQDLLQDDNIMQYIQKQNMMISPENSQQFLYEEYESSNQNLFQSKTLQNTPKLNCQKNNTSYEKKNSDFNQQNNIPKSIFSKFSKINLLDSNGLKNNSPQNDRFNFLDQDKLQDKNNSHKLYMKKKYSQYSQVSDSILQIKNKDLQCQNHFSDHQLLQTKIKDDNFFKLKKNNQNKDNKCRINTLRPLEYSNYIKKEIPSQQQNDFLKKFDINRIDSQNLHKMKSNQNLAFESQLQQKYIQEENDLNQLENSNINSKQDITYNEVDQNQNTDFEYNNQQNQQNTLRNLKRSLSQDTPNSKYTQNYQKLSKNELSTFSPSSFV
ncbi:Cyclic nucleotide-binding protein [Pseudocohnilembus persalinus]|uniref:Cyclic nucleotide-binding protein n=1 Tax=Pseudocohnilembus persalinus TaxID=266149 RepID=A0A0V0R3J1_PSEPJ|nr:Cyclic nucleotide-binding protein [Pseudocohnilembus persalinus]|eukprot:KRX09051.1 Cyclic nucleotide-binding protein [Pseudocohnilembus persalinus]